MTITEFLLARIAEDEAGATGVPHIGCYEDDSDPEGTIHGPRCPNRMLAECKAKRAIIDGFELREEQGNMPGGQVFGYHATGVLFAIRKLAAVYADHPDFRQEWAPIEAGQ